MTKKLTILVFFIASYSFSQNAWTKKKSEVYSQISFTTISDYGNIFGNPDYNTERFITDNTLQLYGEYGLTDKSTLVLSIPIKFNETGRLTGMGSQFTTADSKAVLGNIEIGFRRQFYKKKWVVSGQLNLEGNTNSYSNASGIRTGYDAWTLTPTISIGRSFNWIYFQGFTGVNLRSNNYSSNFRFGAEVGIKPIKPIWIIGFVDVVKSFENGNVKLPINNLLTGLYVNDQEYSAYGLKAIGEVTKKFGATIGFGGAFSGNNVAKKAAVTFGVYHKF